MVFNVRFGIRLIVKVRVVARLAAFAAVAFFVVVGIITFRAEFIVVYEGVLIGSRGPFFELRLRCSFNVILPITVFGGRDFNEIHRIFRVQRKHKNGFLFSVRYPCNAAFVSVWILISYQVSQIFRQIVQAFNNTLFTYRHRMNSEKTMRQIPKEII